MATIKNQTSPHTWLPEAIEDDQRAGNTQKPPPQGAEAIGALVLPKQVRFSKSAFDRARRTGKLRSANRLAVLAADASVSLGDAPKIGMIVSTKISRRAVDRNLLKRRLRAAVRRLLPTLPPSTRAIILPNRRALNASVGELEHDLRALFSTE